MCRYCWEPPISRELRDYLYPREEWDEVHSRIEREMEWEACPDYDALMEREENVLVEEGEWEVWLEEGARPIPNGG